jgi:hypothetical protein
VEGPIIAVYVRCEDSRRHCVREWALSGPAARSKAISDTVALYGDDVLEDSFMRAYVAQVAESELRQFVAEDALPEDVRSQLIREWSLPTMTAVWAVLGDEDAEAVREELQAGCRRDACGVLLDRAVEVRPIVPHLPGPPFKSPDEPTGDGAP